MLTTARMRLIPATAETIRAEIEDRPTFAALLAASIPADWPPEMLADALPWFLEQLEALPERVGWLTWYGVLLGSEPLLAASGGFTGPPRDGTVEIGYSVLPQFQRQGYATEMIAALLAWALTHSDVERIIADARLDNTPSIRLLRRLGFTESGPGAQPDLTRFEIRTGPSKA